MSVSEMTASLQFRSQTMTFASSSSGNTPFRVEVEIEYTFKKTFGKANEKFYGY